MPTQHYLNEIPQRKLSAKKKFSIRTWRPLFQFRTIISFIHLNGWNHLFQLVRMSSSFLRFNNVILPISPHGWMNEYEMTEAVKTLLPQKDLNKRNHWLTNNFYFLDWEIINLSTFFSAIYESIIIMGYFYVYRRKILKMWSSWKTRLT